MNAEIVIVIAVVSLMGFMFFLEVFKPEVYTKEPICIGSICVEFRK